MLAIPAPTEEIIVDEFDEGWRRNMPVKLLTYPDGKQDLHRQTGSQFKDHVEKAKKILAERGLAVGEIGFMGPTGAYMTVTPATATA